MDLPNQPPLLAISLLVLFVASVEAGFRLGALAGVAKDEHRHEHITASRDALGVLLSLLLGFTLAMALPRYDLRRQLVLDEANAISTVGLRAGVLPAPYRQNVHQLLLQYTKARLAYSVAGISAEDIREPLAQTKGLQTQLWNHAEAVAQTSPTPIVSLFLQSLNEMFDLAEKRMAALENRIPPTVWIMLTVIGVMTCLMFGCATRQRFWLVSIITPLMIAVVIGLIADLDSPRNGFIRNDVRSLQRVEHDLEAPPVIPAESTPAVSPPASR